MLCVINLKKPQPFGSGFFMSMKIDIPLYEKQVNDGKDNSC
jgi:hypothetical protein